MLDDPLAGFLEEGLAITLGTRNARLEPNGARVVAVRVDPDRRSLVAYVPQVAAAPLLADLETNRQAALGFARPVDDRACQVKGTWVESWVAGPDERPLVERQWEGFLDQLARVGIPRLASEHWIWWPAVAIRVRVTAVFSQTPGPTAGVQLR